MNNSKSKKYIDIPNELIEAIYKSKMKGTQIAIILTVIKHTYGNKQKQSKLSTSQIASCIGRDRINIAKELNKLINCKIIDVVSSDAQGIRILKINENYSEWQRQSRKRDKSYV